MPDFLISYPDHLVITGLLTAALAAALLVRSGSRWLVASLAAVAVAAAWDGLPAHFPERRHAVTVAGNSACYPSSQPWQGHAGDAVDLPRVVSGGLSAIPARPV